MNRKPWVGPLGPLALLLMCAGMAILASSAAAGGVVSAPTQKGALGFGTDPNTGIVDPTTGGDRYAAIDAGSGTVVERISTEDGRIVRSTYLSGRLSIPAVAYDGSPAGLSADGETLVLSEPGVSFPQRDSVFTVLDTDRLRVLDTVTLPGTFTFDALSPDGRWVYLVEYTSRTDLTEYVVRRYDLQRGLLDPKPILDPDESAEEMYGSPMTRATSPDGRWAYTLYDGSEHPFIHALDTERGEAVCIDLDAGTVAPRRLFRMTLDPSPDGSTLSVVDRGRPIAIVDTETFEVSEPAEEAAADTASDDSSGAPWFAIGLGALAAGGLVGVLLRRRRRTPAVGSDDLERLVRVEEEPELPDLEKERDPVR